MQTSHAVPIPSPTHEFSTEHDTSLTHTAHWARQLGYVCAVAAAFALFSGAFVPAALQVVFAIMFVRAANHVRAIVKTAGNDVAHLTTAAQQLTNVLRVRIVLACLGIPVAVLGFFAGLAVYWR